MDVGTLKNYMAFFNLMTYDMHGDWSPHSGHNAQLDQPTDCWNAGFDNGTSITYSAAYWQGRGLSDSQINLGMAFYGREFTTEDLHQPCSSCEVGGGGVPYSKVVSDYLSGDGWTEYWDATAQSPYARKDSGAGVISFDNPQSIRAKTDYAFNTRNYGGVFMWAMEHDYMGPGDQPLLEEMYMQAFCVPPSPTPTQTSTPVTRQLVSNGGDTAAWALGAGTYNSQNYSAGGSQGIDPGSRFDGSAASSDYGYIEFWAITAGSPANAVASLRVEGAPAGAVTVPLPSFEDMGYAAGQWVKLAVAMEEIHSLAGGAFMISSITISLAAGSVDDVYLVNGQAPQMPSGPGPNHVSSAMAAPNPVADVSQAAVYAQLEGSADTLQVEIYSKAMLKVGQAEISGARKGWNKIPLDSGILEGLANGLYHARVVGIRGGEKGRGAITRIYILR
jgi:hypothetical protein